MDPLLLVLIVTIAGLIAWKTLRWAVVKVMDITETGDFASLTGVETAFVWYTAEIPPDGVRSRDARLTEVTADVLAGRARRVSMVVLTRRQVRVVESALARYSLPYREGEM